MSDMMRLMGDRFGMTSESSGRLPSWFKVPMPGSSNFIKLRNLLRESELHTVCEEAHCPNIGECWDNRSATFMILGDICTRRCGYCAVTTGRPGLVDTEEPFRLANTVKRLGLSYCVITSVNRDDLLDGGASIFAACIGEIRKISPECEIEVLIPDFQGSEDALVEVLLANPDVLNHNIETVTRMFRKVRPKGDYNQSLDLLSKVKRISPDMVTKSGMMVGLGETWDEIIDTMTDLRAVGCDLLTIGQYLRPSAKHFPMYRFYEPEEFVQLGVKGRQLGFRHVASGPLVRSSYHAKEQLTTARNIAY